MTLTSPLTNLKKAIVFLTLAIISCTACQKELSHESSNDVLPVPDYIATINASANGFVTDENDQPVLGAAVTVGSQVVTTDKYGYFEVRNTTVLRDAATVTVGRGGYFKAIKTFIAVTGKTAFFRIKLLPKTIAGTINASAGGTVTLANGLSVSLPAGGVVNASTNLAYSGNVNITAQWINPAAADLAQIMPGDLRGINSNNEVKLLTTYGMAAVELTGNVGELLQVAAGQKATLSLPIPSSIAATAPASIPLWYFDEVKGLWKEEGSATKTGNNYIGQVSHFSFWNCDVPNNYVQLNVTLKGSHGEPIAGAYVKISEVGNAANARFGYTDSSGYVAGAVLNNANLLLEVFGNAICSTPSYTQAFTTGNTNISLGTITISNSVSYAYMHGKIIGCSANAISNGFLIIQQGNHFMRHNVNSSGEYALSTFVCGGGATSIKLIGEDISTMQQSAAINYTLVSGDNAIADITACGTTTQQYFNSTLNSVVSNFSMPADSISCYLNNTAAAMSVNATRIALNGENVSIGFNGIGATVGNVLPLLSFYSNKITGNTTINSGGTVTITEYGTIGQFIAASFTGSCKDASNTTYNFSGNFRVRRYF